METSREERSERLADAFDNLTTEEVVSLWNEALDNGVNYPNDRIYLNNEEFFEQFANNVWDVIRLTQRSEYYISYRYVWFNGNGKLVSSDSWKDMPIDVYVLAEWMCDEEIDLDNYFDEDVVKYITKEDYGEEE